MTLDLHPETVEACRQRDGAAADDRPDSIGDALETPQLGYGEGDPLVAESYDSYPSKAELSNPSQGDFLRRLLSHNKVSSLSDAVAELTGGRDRGHLSDWLATLEAATEVNDLETDNLLAEGSADEGGDDPLTVILGYKPPANVVSVENPLVVAELYQAGLSTVEISELLDGQEGEVRDTLISVGLLEGKTRAEQREAFEDKDGRLGGVSMDFSDSGESGGLTVNAEDYA